MSVEIPVNEQYMELAKRVMGMLERSEKGEGDLSHLTMDNWEWPTGVALYCMYKVYKRANDKYYYDYLTSWYKKQFAKPAPHRNVNTVAPLLAMTCLYEEDKNPEYLEKIMDWGNWVMKEMPRTDYEGLQHMTVLNRHYQQLWDDTLFMTVLFLMKAGKLLGIQEWVEEAKYQFLLHIKYLQDKHTGLWYHGWTFDCRHNFAGAFWARGNSWFTSGGVEFLEMLGEDDPSVSRFVKACLRDQVRAVMKYQGENGLFNTLVDVEESYYETSASAGFAYGMLKGERLGYLPAEYRAAGMKSAKAVIDKIAPDGTVQGVSFGTGMGKTFQFYKDIKICPTAYGQGLTFLMLTELI